MCRTNVLRRYYSVYVRKRRFSELLRTKESIPKNKLECPTTCKSLKLMLQHGIITSSSPGVFNLMPLAVIALQKLTSVIDSLMKSIQGQKVILPTLTLGSLWKTTERWNNPTAHLFKLKDRHGVDYCLGPTHEEAATNIFVHYPGSLKSFPMRMYQISSKFRDELNPKLGLLRGREFVMKDMYSFDVSEEKAQSTYNEVCEVYDKFFQILGVDYVKVLGSSAGMGGSISHEYQFLSNIGDDEILLCSNCGTGFNSEILRLPTADGKFIPFDDKKKCADCGGEFKTCNGIEVGHAFILGTTYSEPFCAKFKDQDGLEKPLQMGCYGLGVTRILAASVECLSTSEQIRWPTVIAPLLVSIIPPKKGSKEEKAAPFADFLFESLSNLSFFSNSIILDDRTSISIGRRVQESNALGIPYTVVTGGPALKEIPLIEVIDNIKNETVFMTHAEFSAFFRSLNNSLTLKYCL